jgi:hypothetical protein
MLDRQKVESILTRRFPGASPAQVAAAANAIMGLVKDWETGVEKDHVRLSDSPWGPDGGADLTPRRQGH